jgi:hypothetical protein
MTELRKVRSDRLASQCRVRCQYAVDINMTDHSCVGICWYIQNPPPSCAECGAAASAGHRSHCSARGSEIELSGPGRDGFG